MPQMIPVQSSNLSSVGYDPATSTLYIAFHSGRTYAYYGVPAGVHKALMLAPSKGRYHSAYIKYAFPYCRL